MIANLLLRFTKTYWNTQWSHISSLSGTGGGPWVSRYAMLTVEVTGSVTHTEGGQDSGHPFSCSMASLPTRTHGCLLLRWTIQTPYKIQIVFFVFLYASVIRTFCRSFWNMYSCLGFILIALAFTACFDQQISMRSQASASMHIDRIAGNKCCVLCVYSICLNIYTYFVWICLAMRVPLALTKTTTQSKVKLPEYGR